MELNLSYDDYFVSLYLHFLFVANYSARLFFDENESLFKK
jgi:hypothetical protein